MHYIELYVEGHQISAVHIQIDGVGIGGTTMFLARYKTKLMTGE